MKKGQIWVSAILYLALGLIIIGLILGIAMPLVNKMRDRNKFIQTKTLLVDLNENIVAVINEGPGSKRFLSPFTIDKGKLYLAVPDEENTLISIIYWEFETKSEIVAKDVVFNEGDLSYKLRETDIAGDYVITATLKYTKADLDLPSNDNQYKLSNPFIGTYSMTIENSGYDESENNPTVTIFMKTT